MANIDRAVWRGHEHDDKGRGQRSGPIPMTLFSAVVGPLIALALIWLPQWRAYWVSPLLVEPAIVERARREPDDQVLKAVAAIHLRQPIFHRTAVGADSRRYTEAAERLLRGEVQFDRLAPIEVDVPFTAANLERGLPTHQLHLAGLATAAILLGAHDETGDDRYLRAAGKEIEAFAAIDRWTLVPRGLLWNDHALAAQVGLLADYWWRVRQRSDLAPEHARMVLSLVNRVTARLAKPELFTYRTNHGVMQNIALLQSSRAFPYLDPDRERARVACGRLTEQLRYYVSPEGPVLEHSAHYHFYGLYLLESFMQLALAEPCGLPAALAQRIARARAFAELLRRPDGSLPVFGNTDHHDSSGDTSDESSWGPPRPTSRLFAASGYAVWWDGLQGGPAGDALAQTVTTWSRFPSNAHKHADDMSVGVWAGGRTWLAGTGYWPYGVRGVDGANGWRGSNAPHIVDEGRRSVAAARLVAAADSPRAHAIELERTARDGVTRINRQIIAIDGRLWLIVDSAVSSRDSSRIARVFGFGPERRLRRLAAGDFLIDVDGPGATTPMPNPAPLGATPAARLSIVGTVVRTPTIVDGQIEPFGGWAVTSGTPVAVPAIEVEQPAGTVVASVLRVGDAPALAALPSPVLADDATPGSWSLRIEPADRATADGITTVRRRSRAIEITTADGRTETLDLIAQADAAAARSAVVSDYQRTVASWSPFPDLLHYRYQLTWWLLGLLCVQELLLWGSRHVLGRATSTLRLGIGLLWVIGGLGIAFVYLVRH
jgi:hypothetical protein